MHFGYCYCFEPVHDLIELLSMFLNHIFITLAVLRRKVYQVCGAHLHVIAPGQHSFQKNVSRHGGKPLATLCPIWPTRGLNLRPPTPETDKLPLKKN